MAFKPVNKEEMNKEQPRVSVNLDLIGEDALAFKKMAEDAKISGKDLVQQMAIYCIGEAAKK